MAVTFWLGGTVGNTNTWSTAANWSTGVAPVTGDTVIVDARGASYAITAGLAQSAVTLAELRIVRGSPDIGTTTAYLAISATLLNINVPPDDGTNATAAALIAVNTGTNASTVTIYGSKNTGTSGLAPVNWKGVHASNLLYVYGDSIVGVATHTPGDVATIPTLQTLGGSQSFTRISSGVTLTTLTQTGGKVSLECAATTINQDGGELETKGTGAITTAYVNGVAKLNSTGTVGTLQVEPSGKVDFTGNTAARTVSNAFIHGGGTINAAMPTVAGAAHAITFTNGIDAIRGAKSGQIDLGGDISITPSAT